MIKLGDILNYIKKNNNKQAIVLNILLHKEFITGAEIMTIGSTAEYQNIFTTCPHSIIRGLRRLFGFDLIRADSVKFNNEVEYFGKKFKVSGVHNRYYIDRKFIEV